MDQSIIDLALNQAKICQNQTNPELAVITSGWISLQLLYVELAKAGQIEQIKNISIAEKRILWKSVIGAIPDASKNRKLWSAQALYMFNLITKEGGYESTI